MARFVSPVPLDRIEHGSERLVAQKLVEQLPEGADVFYSQMRLTAGPGKSGGLQEGEADFIILHPAEGLLVLEVKGGNIRYDARTQEYVRLARASTVTVDPFRQAQKNLHALLERLRRALPGGANPPCAYGYAAIFPDCECIGPAPQGLSSAVVLSSTDLPFLDRRVAAILGEFRRGPRKPLDAATTERIRDGISPRMVLRQPLSLRILGQERELVRLTEQQLELLDVLRHADRVAVRGVAGSGKTLLACEQARRLAAAGTRTLLVCFNRHLAETIADRFARDPQGAPLIGDRRLVVDTFHGFAREACRRAHVPFDIPAGDQSRFWNETAAELLLEAAERLPGERFGAVVLDEGQDFREDWFPALESWLDTSTPGRPTRILAFYDPEQNLFVEDAPGGGLRENGGFLADLPQFELPWNCRNTRQIASHCGGLLRREILIRREAPEGSQVRLLPPAADPAERRAAVERELDRWLGREKLKSGQVAALSPFRADKCCLSGATSLGKWPLTSSVERWRKGEGVLLQTIRAFKGLEADAVILFDAPSPRPRSALTNSDLYVACSRAKHELVVVPSEPLGTASDGSRERD